MPFATRRHAAPVLAAILILLAGAPVAAVNPPPGQPDPATGDRFIVVWQQSAPARVDVAGVDDTIRSANPQRSVVVAERGRGADVLAELRADPRVLAVVPDAVIQAADWPADEPPDDPLYAEQEDLSQVGVPAAWPTTVGEDDVVVAVIDSGVDLSHPDLVGIPVVAPRNETWNTTDVTDTYGHGTHVTGTIFARTDNDIGIAGIAPGATLMPIKVLDDGGYGWISDVLDAVDWARTHGADVINLSLGGLLLPEQAAVFQSTFTAARQAGILTVAAAGNTPMPVMFYPASLDGVVSVAAVDSDDVLAEFSTFNRAVDLSAPGVDTLSTSILDPSGYERYSGTSMASPHVAGIAALVWSARPDLDVVELEAVLRASAEELGEPGRDDRYGDGRVDAAAALAWAIPDPLPNLDHAPRTWTGALEIEFDTPAAPVRQSSTSYGVSWSESHQIISGSLARYGWRTVDGVCPDEFEADPVELEYLDYENPSLNTGLVAGRCYRWEVIAFDESGQFGGAVSAPVTVVDRTAPRITRRVPAPSATDVAPTTSVRITFSEPVRGVSGSTLKLKNVRTGLWVRVAVSYNASTRSATIDPVLSMYRYERYQVVVRSGIRDLAGNALPATTWSFRTRR